MGYFSVQTTAIVWILSMADCALAFPTTTTAASHQQDFSINDATSYLAQFHYMNLDQPDPEVAYLTSEEQFREAVREFQEMAGVAVTGELDDPTIRMMQMPRCGVPDTDGDGSMDGSRKKRYDAQQPWYKNSLTWKISAYTQDMSQSLVDSEVEKAFKVWSDNSGLTFTRVPSYQTADIVVLFARYDHGDGNSFDGPGKVLAHAYFPADGDAHFDDDEDFTAFTSSGTNLFQVAAHEFGHSLGLGHSRVSGALMAPFYTGYQPNFVLHKDDIDGIQWLYGPNTDNPTTTTTTTTTTEANNGNPTIRTTNFNIPTTTTSTTTTTTTMPPYDNPCRAIDGQFDTITLTDDSSTYGFRGSNYFKIATSGLAPGYPRSISSDWPGLPNDLDASVFWPSYYGWTPCTSGANYWCWSRIPGKTYFFKDDRVYIFIDMDFQESKYISEFIQGLPSNLDAAFVWSGNGWTYFIKGSQYYRVKTITGTRVSSGYPRDLSVWWTYSSHQLDRVDAAFQYGNGRTYFFSGDQYYRFYDPSFAIDNGYPRDVRHWWYGCTADDTLGNIEIDDDSNGAVDVTVVTALLSSCVAITIALLL